jgi:hypothetical protein
LIARDDGDKNASEVFDDVDDVVDDGLLVASEPPNETAK